MSLKFKSSWEKALGEAVSFECVAPSFASEGGQLSVVFDHFMNTYLLYMRSISHLVDAISVCRTQVNFVLCTDVLQAVLLRIHEVRGYLRDMIDASQGSLQFDVERFCLKQGIDVRNDAYPGFGVPPYLQFLLPPDAMTGRFDMKQKELHAVGTAETRDMTLTGRDKTFTGTVNDIVSRVISKGVEASVPVAALSLPPVVSEGDVKKICPPELADELGLLLSKSLVSGVVGDFKRGIAVMQQLHKSRAVHLNRMKEREQILEAEFAPIAHSRLLGFRLGKSTVSSKPGEVSTKAENPSQNRDQTPIRDQAQMEVVTTNSTSPSYFSASREDLSKGVAEQVAKFRDLARPILIREELDKRRRWIAEHKETTGSFPNSVEEYYEAEKVKAEKARQMVRGGPQGDEGVLSSEDETKDDSKAKGKTRPSKGSKVSEISPKKSKSGNAKPSDKSEKNTGKGEKTTGKASGKSKKAKSKKSKNEETEALSPLAALFKDSSIVGVSETVFRLKSMLAKGKQSLKDPDFEINELRDAAMPIVVKEAVKVVDEMITAELQNILMISGQGAAKKAKTKKGKGTKGKGKKKTTVKKVKLDSALASGGADSSKLMTETGGSETQSSALPGSSSAAGGSETAHEGRSEAGDEDNDQGDEDQEGDDANQDEDDGGDEDENGDEGSDKDDQPDDGQTVAADGETIAADGETVIADGETIVADGETVAADDDGRTVMDSDNDQAGNDQVGNNPGESSEAEGTIGKEKKNSAAT